jgi:hypothetical protein
MHLNEPMPDLPSTLGISKGLESIVRKCMEKDSKDRYQSAADLATALRTLSNQPETRGARAAAAMGSVPTEPEVTEEAPTGRDWRRQGKYTVLGEIGKDDRKGFRRHVQAGADEVVVIRKNGEITNVYSEDRKPTRTFGEFLKSLIGLGPNTEIYKSTKTRFDLVFWMGDDDTVATGNKSFTFGLPVMTKDNQVIPARINLWLEVDENLAENALLLLRGKNVLNRLDIASEIRDDLLAKVLGLELNQYMFDELRGNRDLLVQIGSSIQREISGILGAFGLRVQDYSINWGLSSQERADIDQQRHQVSLEHVRTLNTIDKISVPAEAEARPLELMLKPSVSARIVAVVGLLTALIYLGMKAPEILDEVGGITGLAIGTSEDAEPLDGSNQTEIVVPGVQFDSEIYETLPLTRKASGGYESVIPSPDVAALAHMSKLDIASADLPDDVEVSISPVLLNTLAPAPENTTFLRSMDITLIGAGNTESLPGQIEFRVRKNWLEDESIQVENVALLRYKEPTSLSEGAWTQLPTTYSGFVLGPEDEPHRNL